MNPEDYGLFISDSLLSEVKTTLRITTTQFDENEIKPLINSAAEDMKRVGITVDPSNPLHRQAIKHYCKGYFGDNPNQSAWQEAYAGLRDALSFRKKRDDEE